jgi:hypothetical protein
MDCAVGHARARTACPFVFDGTSCETIMSLNALANSATARRPDFAPLGTVPRNIIEVAVASAPPFPLPAPAAAGQPAGNDGVAGAAPVPARRGADATLNVLFGYIPTEIITLYVAVLGAFSDSPGLPARRYVFYVFLVGTPIVFWLVYAAKLKAAGKELPLTPGRWPVWEMFAATLAFTVWAFALPNPPFPGLEWYTPALSSVAVLLVSTILGLLAPIFQRPLEA